jgi:hypothetical protein
VLRLNNQVTSKSISQNSTGEFNLRSGKVFWFSLLLLFYTFSFRILGLKI